MTGALKITSRRHFTDFAEMTSLQATSFGPLLTRLDTALWEVTGAERVHLVSTRDRVRHFHAWLHPRPASHPLRGTEFLTAPSTATPPTLSTPPVPYASTSRVCRMLSSSPRPARTGRLPRSTRRRCHSWR